MTQSGREVHAKAEEAREAGDFLKALQCIEESSLLYSEEKDLVGFAEVQGSRFLTLRHLFEKTGDTNYLVLAKYAALGAAELADKSGIPSAIALPYYNLAKAHDTLGEFSLALNAYKKAVSAQEKEPDLHHARSAVLNDMKVHLAICEFKNGDKESLWRAENALADLEADNEEGKYTKDVWTSGGHMKLAEVLRSERPDKAKIHLQKAKQIIDANPDLKLRIGQWEKLNASFK